MNAALVLTDDSGQILYQSAPILNVMPGDDVKFTIPTPEATP